MAQIAPSPCTEREIHVLVRLLRWSSDCGEKSHLHQRANESTKTEGMLDAWKIPSAPRMAVRQ